MRPFGHFTLDTETLLSKLSTTNQPSETAAVIGVALMRKVGLSEASSLPKPTKPGPAFQLGSLRGHACNPTPGYLSQLCLRKPRSALLHLAQTQGLWGGGSPRWIRWVLRTLTQAEPAPSGAASLQDAGFPCVSNTGLCGVSPLRGAQGEGCHSRDDQIICSRHSLVRGGT